MRQCADCPLSCLLPGIMFVKLWRSAPAVCNALTLQADLSPADAMINGRFFVGSTGLCMHNSRSSPILHLACHVLACRQNASPGCAGLSQSFRAVSCAPFAAALLCGKLPVHAGCWSHTQLQAQSQAHTRDRHHVHAACRARDELQHCGCEAPCVLWRGRLHRYWRRR